MRQASPPPDVQKDGDSDFAELTLLDDVDVSDQLVKRKKEDGTGHEIRGGSVDALIVHAASTGRHGKGCNKLPYLDVFLKILDQN